MVGFSTLRNKRKLTTEEKYGIKNKTASKTKIPEHILYQASRCGFKSINDFWETSQFIEITGTFGEQVTWAPNEYHTCRVYVNGAIDVVG